MSAKLACIAGEEVYRQWNTGQLEGTALGVRPTPFGDSGEVFLIETDQVDADENQFYLLARNREGMEVPAGYRINARANLYALKDIGVDFILGWGAGGAIRHTIAVGDLVVLDDLIDQTNQRNQTYFEDSPLGMLRQFPVFCDFLQRLLAEALQEKKLIYHGSGVAAVREGPRMETPAEVRMLSQLNAEIITHSFAPEMFLARELQMGYAAVCYVTHYAETGSRHHPFAGGGLFGGLSQQSDSDRLAGAVGALGTIASHLAGLLGRTDTSECNCLRSQQNNIRKYNLPDDWHGWFEHR
jgi:5'-methylthioadenosine phosphorylase